MDWQKLNRQKRFQCHNAGIHLGQWIYKVGHLQGTYTFKSSISRCVEKQSFWVTLNALLVYQESCLFIFINLSKERRKGFHINQCVQFLNADTSLEAVKCWWSRHPPVELQSLKNAKALMRRKVRKWKRINSYCLSKRNDAQEVSWP